MSLFSAKEVKTALSFFFRLTTITVGLVAFGVWVLQPGERLDLFIGAGIIIVLLATIVGAIAWFKPKHLVYGESGFRAETRLTLGTEKEQIDADDLANLQGTSNPASIGIVKTEGQ